MIPENTTAWGMSKSCIRDLAAYGVARKAQIGAENVFDFSIGNPSIPAPACVNKAIENALKMDSIELHGYTAASGIPSLRAKIASHRNNLFGGSLTGEDIYVTCGAAAALAISFKALLIPEDEVIAIAPFFPEYRVFVEGAGGKLVVVQSKPENFQLDLDAIEKAVNAHTKAIIINSPNNPSGVVLGEDCLKELASLLEKMQIEYEHDIFIICDEPYRELIYGDVSVPCMTRIYDNTIVCYSYSKTLSIPGERIGYIAVCEKMRERQAVFASIQGAGRCLGYVNPPSLFQRVVEDCIGEVSDISQYKTNRDILLQALEAMGFDCVRPDGAFYLFMKSPEKDAKQFSERAKKYELLLVPADDFGCPGYVRIAYCVSRKTIEDSLPAFEELAQNYGL